MEDHKKLAQEQLAQARACLAKAAEHAELGKFPLEFDKSYYYPNSLYETWGRLDVEGKLRLLGRLAPDQKFSITDEDEIASMEDSLCDEFWRKEYSEVGEWWQPSTC